MCKRANFLFALVLVALSGEASGSSCPDGTLHDQVRIVDTIVYALLTEAHFMESKSEQISGTFKVHEVIKGQVEQEFVVTTSADWAFGSGVPLTVGFYYLLFFDSDIFGISSCSGSGQQPTQDRIEDVKRIVHGNRVALFNTSLTAFGRKLPFKKLSFH